jgi:hypothetical protein
LALPARFRPLLVGIHWPSAALTFGDENAPNMAAETGEARDLAVAAETDRVRDLAEALPAAAAARFYALLQQPRLSAAEVQELAQLAAPLYAATDDELADDAALTAESVAAAWSALADPAARNPLASLASPAVASSVLAPPPTSGNILIHASSCAG